MLSKIIFVKFPENKSCCLCCAGIPGGLIILFNFSLSKASERKHAHSEEEGPEESDLTEDAKGMSQ